MKNAYPLELAACSNHNADVGSLKRQRRKNDVTSQPRCGNHENTDRAADGRDENACSKWPFQVYHVLRVAFIALHLMQKSEYLPSIGSFFGDNQTLSASLVLTAVTNLTTSPRFRPLSLAWRWQQGSWYLKALVSLQVLCYWTVTLALFSSVTLTSLWP